MAAPVFVRTAEPASPADIQAIEREYGFTLPEDYKAHLLRYNGGRPQRRTFMQADADEPGRYIPRRVSDFKSVRHGTSTLDFPRRSGGRPGRRIAASVGLPGRAAAFARTGKHALRKAGYKHIPMG